MILPQFYQEAPQAPTPQAPHEAIAPELTDFWEKIVPHLFKTGLTRTSKDGGLTYPRSTEQPLPAHIPDAPTANRIYQPDGFTYCIALDFDNKDAAGDAVAADVAKATDFLASHGITRTIIDISPSGGQHLYVPLDKSLPFAAAKMITAALKTLLPTLDPSPMNGATDGVIRVPGSAHKSGGHQKPLTSLGAALMAVHIRNPLPAVNSLYQWAKGVKEATAHVNRTLLEATGPAVGEPLSGKELIKAARALPGTRTQVLPLMPEWAHMAATGTWDKNRYPSASEARLGFTRACVRAGHTFATFLAALKTPAFAGAAKLWARYAPAHRLSAMARDFSKAHSYKGKDTHVQECNTRDNLHTPPTGPDAKNLPVKEKVGAVENDAYLLVRQWFAAVQRVEADRYSQNVSARLVLRALGSMAQRTGEVQVAVGVRSLALATGLSAATVSRLLRVLRDEADPFIRLIAPARGLDAAVYELTIPAHLEDSAQRTWFTGLIPAVDKAFFGLPVASPLVYEALAQAPTSSIDLAAICGLPVRTVQAVLEELATLGLAKNTGAGWALGNMPLRRAALISGGAALFAAMVAAIRAQRTAWYTWVMGRITGSGYQPAPDDVGVSIDGQIYDAHTGAWLAPAV